MKDRTCIICGAAFLARAVNQLTCSVECRHKRIRERERKYRAANPELIRALARKYYAANPERVRERVRKYCKANPERRREQIRKYREAKRKAAEGVRADP